MISKREQAGPDSLRPMLATAGTLPARDAGWAYEMKWDGIRALAFLDGDVVRLRSRTGRDISHVYPELAGMAAVVDARQAVLDGEVVAFGDDGWPEFEALQQRMNIASAAQARALAASVPVSYLAFDLLWRDDKPLIDQPYADRRTGLDGLGPDRRQLAGPAVLHRHRRRGCAGGLAGATAGRHRGQAGAVQIRAGPPVTVLAEDQELPAPGGGRRRLAAGRGRPGGLDRLAARRRVRRPHELVYSGHVGTGFTQQTLRMLAAKLTPLRRDTSPFGDTVPPEDARYARWVEPVLVAEIAYTHWTRVRAGFRAPSYKGLRDDKDAAEVVREQ